MLHGRRFKVLAVFTNTQSGKAQSNAYMAANPGSSVLAVDGPEIILAHLDDKGVPA